MSVLPRSSVRGNRVSPRSKIGAVMALFAALALVTLACLQPQAAGAAGGLRIATTLQSSDPVYSAVVALGRASSELTQAKASIQAAEKGTVRERAQQALRLLKDEKADMAVLEMSAIADKPILGYSLQPFLAKDIDAARRLDLRLRRDVTRILQTDLNLELLGTLPQLPRVVLSKRPSWNGSLYGGEIFAPSRFEQHGLVRLGLTRVKSVAAEEIATELAADATAFGIVPLSLAVVAGKTHQLYLYDVRASYPVMAVVTTKAVMARFPEAQRAALVDLVHGFEALAWERIDRVAERVLQTARADKQTLFGELTAAVGDNYSKLVTASLDANARQSVSEIVAMHSQKEQQQIKAFGDEQVYGRKCRNLEILLVTNRALPDKTLLGLDGALPRRGEELLASLTTDLHYGVVDVQVPARSFDPPSTLGDCREADGRSATTRGVTLHRVRLLDRSQFVAIAAGAGTSFDVHSPFLVFVHGYRVNFRDGVETVARLSVRMRNAMRPVLVSWPSAGALWSYGEDGKMADGSPPALQAALETLASVRALRPIALVAHSMGNRIVLAALESMRRAGRTGILDELASVAPDVQCATYASIMQKLQAAATPAGRMFRRATLYLYEDDAALKWSKRYWAMHDRSEMCRMGSQRGPAAAGVSGLEPVDWSCINEIVDSHSYYVQNDYIARDLRDTVQGHRMPQDRDLEPIQVPPASRYFLHLGVIDRDCAGVH